jgi:hypothetical protein
MATYTELFNFAGSAAGQTLRRKIRFALRVKAQAIAALPLTGENASTPESRAWAVNTLRVPEVDEELVFNYLLADGRGQTIAFLTALGADTEQTDTGIQSVVNAAVDRLLVV